MLTNTQIEKVLAAVYDAGCDLVETQPHVEGSQKADGTWNAVDRRDGNNVDERIETKLKDALRSAAPGWEFVGEELEVTGPLDADKPWTIVDPIEGTAPYIRGMGYYAISLLMIHKYPVLAVLYLPAMRRWYVASFVNQTPEWRRSATFHEVSAEGNNLRIAPAWPATDPAGLGDALEKRFRFKERLQQKGKDSYLWFSSDAHHKLDLRGFRGKNRSLGATGSHQALLLDEGTTDPRAVAITRAYVWDVAAGLVLASAAGVEVHDLRSGDLVEVEDLIRGGLANRKERTPPLILTVPGDAFAGGVRLAGAPECIVAVDPDNSDTSTRPVDRRQAHAEGVPHRAVHIEIKRRDGRYFVWHRPDGRLEIPGGHVDWLAALGRAESYHQACVRELIEELDLEQNWKVNPAARLQSPNLRHTATVANRLPSSQGNNNEWVAVFQLDWAKDWGDPADPGQWELRPIGAGGEGVSPRWVAPDELARAT
jgi:fructose-1,6-bisphosphatase/inositol monophosphatase family enzyme/8-oxo-dGTP pyrophosphatase MutT (NUDIX family)